jgi:hypothetical protein
VLKYLHTVNKPILPIWDRLAGPIRLPRFTPRQGATLRKMPRNISRFVLAIAAALLACSLSACGTINQKLAEGVGDYVPQWLGGLPPDAPPRPGTAKYEEMMREREKKRLEPAPTPEAQQTSSSELAPVH